MYCNFYVKVSIGISFKEAWREILDWICHFPIFNGSYGKRGIP
jgi:hypothetical protein